MEYLKKAREAAGISQAQVAKVFKYKTPQFISNWERGESVPPVAIIPELAKMYGVSSEDLYGKIKKEILYRHALSLDAQYLEAVRPAKASPRKRK